MNNPSRTLRRLSVAAAAGALVAACATAGVPPVSQMATARASIANAESANALNAAPVELLAARDKLGKAEAAVREKRFRDAQWLAEQAEADADLASRKARAVKAEATVAELARGNEQLRKETESKGRP